MTEEEKKAIEYLKDYIKSDLNYFTIDFNDNLRIAINLIEKLQKENEELRKNQKYKKDFNGEKIFCLEYDKETLRDMVLEKQEEIKELKSNSIPKDKIRELLEKLNLKLDKLKQEVDKEYDTYGKSSFYLDLDEQRDYLYEIKELLEEE